MRNWIERHVARWRNKQEISDSTDHTNQDNVTSDAKQSNPAFDHWRYFKHDWPKCSNLEDFVRGLSPYNVHQAGFHRRACSGTRHRRQHRVIEGNAQLHGREYQRGGD